MHSDKPSGGIPWPATASPPMVTAIDLAPRAADLAPRAADLAPCAIDLAPRAADLAPRAADLAPCAIDLAPRAADLVPYAIDLVPRAIDLVPRDVDLVPRAAGGVPLIGEIGPCLARVLTWPQIREADRDGRRRLIDSLERLPVPAHSVPVAVSIRRPADPPIGVDGAIMGGAPALGLSYPGAKRTVHEVGPQYRSSESLDRGLDCGEWAAALPSVTAGPASEAPGRARSEERERGPAHLSDARRVRRKLHRVPADLAEHARLPLSARESGERGEEEQPDPYDRRDLARRPCAAPARALAVALVRSPDPDPIALGLRLQQDRPSLCAELGGDIGLVGLGEWIFVGARRSRLCRGRAGAIALSPSMARLAMASPDPEWALRDGAPAPRMGPPPARATQRSAIPRRTSCRRVSIHLITERSE